MTATTYTVFAQGHSKGWDIFEGCLDHYQQASKFGQPTYTVSASPLALVLNKLDMSEADAETIAPGLTNQAPVPEVVAITEKLAARKAKITGLTVDYRAIMRKSCQAWKFVDVNNIKYKWYLVDTKRHWGLESSKGVTVATFDSNLFEGQEPGYITLHNSFDEDMRSLVFLSWALAAKTLFRRRLTTSACSAPSITVYSDIKER
ncbi:hypothetical protein DL89DRAFT_269220 [Linderina pennispora]|uniref:Uncharacterized protein n=1 Tax=Linderina pennispora TaxID=61395 RepID=A0A1Y1W1K4_9FUNG|nr:uncharacterized protein DL89DRAFT_269220 [Linderina pennispora]ORX67387.1 hypothetical protein DL89DRAFT_269220 [Linderina pennispora]